MQLNQKEVREISAISEIAFETVFQDAKRLFSVNNAYTLAEMEALENRLNYLEKIKQISEIAMKAFTEGFKLFSQGGALMPKKWYDIFAIIRLYKAGSLMYKLIVDIAKIWKS